MPTTTTKNDNTDPKKVVDQVIHEDDPDKEIEVLEGGDANGYVADLAFMNEPVEVMILESGDKNDSTRMVSVGINGKQYHFLRGQWRTVPRAVLAILARTRRESWTFSYKKNSDGSTADTNTMRRQLRYPHQFKDKNPKGELWYNSLTESL